MSTHAERKLERLSGLARHLHLLGETDDGGKSNGGKSSTIGEGRNEFQPGDLFLQPGGGPGPRGGRLQKLDALTAVEFDEKLINLRVTRKLPLLGGEKLA